MLAHQVLPLLQPVKPVNLAEGVIVAQRHIHMSPENALKLGVTDQQIVSVKIHSDRPVILEDVLVRVNGQFNLSMHIDFDEANACALGKETKGEILWMNQEAFVQLIVQKVMERIGKQAWFVPESEQREAFEAYLLETAAHQVRLVSSPEEADVICLPAASAKLFAEIGKGYGDHEHTAVILAHLAQGKSVYVLEDGIPYRRHAATCPAKLYDKWLGYEETVQSYGVKFVKREDLFAGGKSDLASKTAHKTICHVDQRVVTEKVLSLIPQRNTQTIAIGKDAILTPLAQDYIRQEQLEVKRVSERS